MDNNRSKMRNISRLLMISWIVISIWGIMNVFSATYTQFIAKQIFPKSVFTSIIGFVGCFFILFFMQKKYNIFYNLVTKNINAIYLFSLLALILTMFIGGVRGGARSVIDLGIVDFQPLEMLKITCVLFLASAFSNRCLKMKYFKLNNLTKSKDLAKLAGFMLIAVGLVFIQPDLGGAIIIFLVIYVMFVLNGAYAYKILKASAIVILFAVLALFLFNLIPEDVINYQLARISSWLHPFSSPSEDTWGINNSLIGISNGGVLGVGYLHGNQKTFLATGAATDYIFVTICEEWGIIGCLFTIGLILTICYLCIRIGNYAHRRFGMLYCYGYAFLLLIQLVVNIGGITNIIPMTGVTLPFISNGINSYLFLSLGLFFCIVIQRRSSAFYKQEREKFWDE